MTQKKQKKAELENEVDLCTRKLERAEQLITGFGGEREKWAETTLKLEKKLNQLTGDILLAVGTVAYLGKKQRGYHAKIWHYLQLKAKKFVKLNYSCISRVFLSPVLYHGKELLKFNFTKFCASICK